MQLGVFPVTVKLDLQVQEDEVWQILMIMKQVDKCNHEINELNQGLLNGVNEVSQRQCAHNHSSSSVSMDGRPAHQ